MEPLVLSGSKSWREKHPNRKPPKGIPTTPTGALEELLNKPERFDPYVEAIRQRPPRTPEKKKADEEYNYRQGYTTIPLPDFPLTADELAEVLAEVRRQAVAIAGGGEWQYSQPLTDRLLLLANHPIPFFWFGTEPQLHRGGGVDDVFVAVARGFHQVLTGDAYIGCCQAPKPRVAGKTCGRYFVALKGGPMQKTCSGACRTRLSRRK
ncbi:MAG: hypothetical protein ABFE07_20640 [Armatimonadia bacterium]